MKDHNPKFLSQNMGKFGHNLFCNYESWLISDSIDIDKNICMKFQCISINLVVYKLQHFMKL